MATAKVEKRVRKEGNMRAIVIKASNDAASTSRSIADPWDISSLDANWGIIWPPFDFLGLEMLKENSSELGSNIEAMATNIPGFGWRLKRLKHSLPAEGEEPDPAVEVLVEEERNRLENFLTYANYDNRKSLTKLRGMLRKDLETTGNTFQEVIRDLSNKPCSWKFLPAYTMRLTVQDPELVPVKVKQRVRMGGRMVIRIITQMRRFRKFVQARIDGPFGMVGQRSSVNEERPSVIWFKEYGDPRTMDWRDGQYKDPETLDRRYHATEVLHDTLESSRTPYGIPRWIGALVPLLGVRSAEEINFATFNNNNIPSMAILVSGGFLTEGTINRISQFMESTIQGDDNMSRFVIIEAESLEDEMGDSGNVKLDLKPLTSVQHTDALFGNYDEKSREKVRQSFRIPPLLVGRSEDYTRSTADTSRRVADEQIFDPERREEDQAVNFFLLQEFDTLYHEFVTNTPNVTNDQDLIKVMTGSEKTGGMTPRIAHLILEDILGRELPSARDIDPDVPFSLQMAEAVKNQALPNEPGQQVTALKNAQNELHAGIERALAAGHSAEDILEYLIDSGAEVGLDAQETLQLLGLGDD